MKKTLFLLLAVLAFCDNLFATKIKDLANIVGVRDNQLIGYGLVVGLGGTGDGSTSVFTTQSLSNLLATVNVKIDPKDIRAEVQSKTVKIYDGMKAKNAAEIFDQMINEGKIEDVFDIILRLRESNVTQILKFLTVTNASRLTQKLEKYNLDKEKKD
jgi:hypothetical protein